MWIYTVCNGRVYLGSAGQGLKMFNDDDSDDDLYMLIQYY